MQGIVFRMGGKLKISLDHLLGIWFVPPYDQEYIRARKESVVLRIAMYKCTLKSTKVKLCNATQNIPQTSGAVTARTRVVAMHELCAIISLPHAFYSM